MSDLTCGRCYRELRPSGETIEVVDPLRDYEVAKVRVFTCDMCNASFHVIEDDGGKAE